MMMMMMMMMETMVLRPIDQIKRQIENKNQDTVGL